MKTLVTGSEGFIGSHVLSHLEDPVRYDLELGHDIRTKIKIDEDIDRIIHLAAEADVISPWYSVYAHNVVGTKHVLDLADRKNADLIFASSMAVDQPHAYGRSKKIGEEMIKGAEVDAKIYRIANVVGEGSPRGRGQVGTLIDQAFQGEIRPWGNGMITRSFVDVRDVARIMANGEEYEELASWTSTNNMISNIVAQAVDQDVDIKPVEGEDIPEELTMDKTVTPSRSLKDAIEAQVQSYEEDGR